MVPTANQPRAIPGRGNVQFPSRSEPSEPRQQQQQQQHYGGHGGGYGGGRNRNYHDRDRGDRNNYRDHNRNNNNEREPREEIPKIKEPSKPIFEETETDKVADKKKRTPLVPSFKLNSYDSTVNVLCDEDGQLFTSVQSDGLNFLSSQIKANYGIKKNRYYFEVQFLEAGPWPDCRIGLSLSSSKWVGGEGSISFDNLCKLRVNGENTSTNDVESLHIGKNDVVGLLVNLDAKAENKDTVSLFINGLRRSKPISLPDNMKGQPLYPHIASKSASVSVNFGPNLIKPLAFSVHTACEAFKVDVEESKVKAVTTPSAYCIFGGSEEQTGKHVEQISKQGPVVELTSTYLQKWAEESGCRVNNNANAGTKFGIMCLDNPHLFLSWIRTKSRNVVSDSDGNSYMFAQQRKNFCDALPRHKKVSMVPTFATKDSRPLYKYEEVTLPTKEEGFDDLKWDESEKKAVTALEQWKFDQKVRSKIEGFRAGEHFATKFSTWTKFVTEKKATEEGKALSEEDWMLADIRAEIHYMIQSFKCDSSDVDRPSFTPHLLQHYYKMYLKNKNFSANNFGCKVTEDVLKEHLSDSFTVNESGLVDSKLPMQDLKALQEELDKKVAEEKEAKEVEAAKKAEEAEEKVEEVKKEEGEVKKEEGEEKKEEKKDVDMKEEKKEEVIDEFSRDVNNKIFELCTKQRNLRLLRVGAGDELSELKFTARGRNFNRDDKGRGKGHKGGKRNQPMGGFHNQGPGAQRIRAF